MIFLSYLSGSHVLFKVILALVILYLGLRYLTVTKFSLGASILLFLASLSSFVFTNEIDMRVWAQWGVFTLVCILGYQYSPLYQTRQTQYLVFLTVLATCLIWVFDFNFPVGKGRLFLDDKVSGLAGQTINGFGSEVNYTAFFLLSVVAIFSLKNNSQLASFLLPLIGLLQNNNAAYVVFIIVFFTLITRRAWVPVAILICFFGVISAILELHPDIGMPLFGPRYILWNTAIDIIEAFPSAGYGYENSRNVMENSIIDFDKQYYVHNGFLEAGMAAGPIYMFIGCLIIVARLYLFAIDGDYRHSALLCSAVVFITFNSGFLGTISIGGLLVSMLIGCRRVRNRRSAF